MIKANVNLVRSHSGQLHKWKILVKENSSRHQINLYWQKSYSRCFWTCFKRVNTLNRQFRISMCPLIKYSTLQIRFQGPSHLQDLILRGVLSAAQALGLKWSTLQTTASKADSPQKVDLENAVGHKYLPVCESKWLLPMTVEPVAVRRPWAR